MKTFSSLPLLIDVTTLDNISQSQNGKDLREGVCGYSNINKLRPLLEAFRNQMLCRLSQWPTSYRARGELNSQHPVPKTGALSS